MNKSGTDKKNKRRPSCKVTAQNSEYIQQWIDKDQTIADWVNKAVEFKHLDNERQKKASDYSKMLESGTFQENTQLKKDIDYLIRGQDRSDSDINVLKISLKRVEEQVKYFKEEYEEEEKILDMGASKAKKLLKEYDSKYPEIAQLLTKVELQSDQNSKKIWGKEYKKHKKDLDRIAKKINQKRNEKRKRLFKK